MRGLVSPMPLRRSYRTKFRVFSGEADSHGRSPSCAWECATMQTGPPRASSAALCEVMSLLISRMARCVVLDRPAAGHRDGPAITPCMDEFPYPAPFTEHRCGDRLQRLRTLGVQESVHDCAQDFGLPPAILLLGPTVPKDNSIL